MSFGKRRRNIRCLAPSVLVEVPDASIGLVMTESHRTSTLSQGPKLFILNLTSFGDFHRNFLKQSSILRPYPGSHIRVASPQRVMMIG